MPKKRYVILNAALNTNNFIEYCMLLIYVFIAKLFNIKYADSPIIDIYNHKSAVIPEKQIDEINKANKIVILGHAASDLMEHIYTNKGDKTSADDIENLLERCSTAATGKKHYNVSLVACEGLTFGRFLSKNIEKIHKSIGSDSKRLAHLNKIKLIDNKSIHEVLDYKKKATLMVEMITQESIKFIYMNNQGVLEWFTVKKNHNIDIMLNQLKNEDGLLLPSIKLSQEMKEVLYKISLIDASWVLKVDITARTNIVVPCPVTGRKYNQSAFSFFLGHQNDDYKHTLKQTEGREYKEYDVDGKVFRDGSPFINLLKGEPLAKVELL